MTKNIEDLLYRGDSLERMGELSGRLREDSKKYKRAAVRINWELLVKQVSARRLPLSVSQSDDLKVWAICGCRPLHDHPYLVALFLILPKPPPFV